MEALNEFLESLSVFSVLAPFLLGIAFYRKLDSNSHWLVVLLALASIAQLASFLPTKDELKVYNLYAIIDPVVWAFMFFRNSKRYFIKLAICIITILQISAGIYLAATEGISEGFLNEMVCLNSISQTLWVLLFFYERYISEEIEALEKEPMFWFCLGLLIYGPTTYFHFVYFPISANLRFLHHLFNSLMYLVFAIGMYVNVKRVNFKNAFS
jgi:hypothetical protein